MNKLIAVNDPECRNRLDVWFKHHAAFGEATEVVSVEAINAGQSSDMMRVVCTDGIGADKKTFILRRQPQDKQIFLRPNVLRESAVLQGLARAEMAPVPAVLAEEATGGIVGAPFFVMPEISGLIPLGRPSNHVDGALTKMTPQARGRAWLSALTAIANIHRTPWQDTHPFLAEPDRGPPSLQRHLNHYTEWYTWTARGRSFPITDKALDYLQKNCAAVDGEPPVLVWNDARIGNMIFSPAGDVKAVIDWEGATIGPAGIDIGYWVMMDEFHAEAIGIPRLPGWPSLKDAIKTYEQLSGRKIAHLEYFVILAAFFIGTTMIRQADMGIESGTLRPDTGLAHGHTANQIAARHLGLPIPALDADYIKRRRLG